MLLYFHCISGAPELWMWGAIASSCWLIDWLIDVFGRICLFFCLSVCLSICLYALTFETVHWPRKFTFGLQDWCISSEYVGEIRLSKLFGRDQGHRSKNACLYCSREACIRLIGSLETLNHCIEFIGAIQINLSIYLPILFDWHNTAYLWHLYSRNCNALVHIPSNEKVCTVRWSYQLTFMYSNTVDNIVIVAPSR